MSMIYAAGWPSRTNNSAIDVEREKGTGTFCLKGPTTLRVVPGASHKIYRFPFPGLFHFEHSLQGF